MTDREDASSSSTSILIALTGVVGAVVLYIMLASGAEDASDEPPDPAATVPDTVNTLTTAEREAGWQLLFDGSSLDGWRGYQQESVPDSWSVDEGAVHFSGESNGDGGTIITRDTYDHFELRIEWKISPEGNSGIMYRVTEEADAPYKTGPEFQVLDNAALDESDSLHHASALYGLYATRGDVTKPVGQYNEARIVVRGSQIEHWMNGTKLVDAEIGGEEWKQRVAGTKFADYPNFATAERGHIALQDHGDPVWFRDIKLRSLDVES